MHYTKPSLLHYRIAQFAAWFLAKIVFRRKFIRNEIKKKKGAFVVIANHECAYDFVNLIGATKRPMSFVISRSFYNSLPIKGFMAKMGVIPKQQFQTSASDLKKMKAVVDRGEPVAIYPAGLMCEDGLSTPIPAATYKFLKWLGADVYVARSRGSYFVMPKWTKGVRPGRTYMDIYRLFTREELEQMDEQQIREKAEAAILFDAYREQETDQVKYAHGDCVEGLENVLYACPECGNEFTVTVRNGNTFCCQSCGYELVSDEYGLLHNEKGFGKELRYVSDWSKKIQTDLREKLSAGIDTHLSATAQIHMIDPKKDKFVPVGSGTLSICPENFYLVATVNGEEADLTIPIGNFPILPFSPGKYLELQHGSDIYRCVLDDGKLVMKFIYMLKIYHNFKAITKRPCTKAHT